MVVRRILAFLVGAFLVMCGIDCTMMPQSAYISLSWVVGFAIIIDSMMQLYTWDHLKNLNFWNKWDIVGSIVSLIVGIALVCSFGLREQFSLIMIYVFGGWLVICGILRVVSSLRLREFHVEFKTELLGKKWWLILIIGILLIAMGVLMCCFPIQTEEIIGILVGIGIITTGLHVALYSIIF